jgi:hypothetical protein
MCLIVLAGTASKVLKKDKVVWKYVDLDKHTGKAYPLTYGKNGFGYWPGVTMYQPIRKYDSDLDDTPAYADLNEREFFDDVLTTLESRHLMAASLSWIVRRGYFEAWTEGFHFYETKDRARQTSNAGRYELCRFVVPKGTRIILSGNGVGIAEAITYSPLPEKEKKKGK